MDEKEAQGCAILALFSVFVIAAAISLGMLVSPWLGFLFVAIAAFVVFVKASIIAKKMDGDGDGR